MADKAKERPRPHELRGERRDCGTCITPPGHVRADEVWARHLARGTGSFVRIGR